MKNLVRLPFQGFSYYIRSLFDLKLFRQQQSLKQIQKSLQSRFKDPHIATNTAKQLDNHKKNLYDLQQANKQINKIQKQIKVLMKSNEEEQKKIQRQASLNQKIEQLAKLKESQKDLQSKVKTEIKQIQDNILKIGNIVSESSPISRQEKDNKVIKEFLPKINGQTTAKLLQHSHSYSDICEQFGLTDLKRGQKVGGHRGYFLKGAAVRLALALAQYGINFLQGKGYQVIQSPAIINQSTLRGSCQLQSIQEDVYKLEGSDSYLIATSQQSLAGYYKDEVLPKSKLPIRMAGYSTCFRKQAGAHGKDIHGLFRVHQFEKVEQFCIVEPEHSQNQMENMMKISQQFYQSLGVPFRVVNIVTGELNDAASCKYDLQAWFPSQKRYRQLVSVSNCTQYQSRLLKTQYQGNKNILKYPHMLNGTLVAIQRSLTCLIENNYHQSYISIPKVLQPYAGIERIEKPNKQDNK